MRPITIVFFALGACALTTSCGGDDDNSSASSGTCSAVCACVVDHGGDLQTCNDQCQQTVQAGGNQKLSCETKLDGFGYPVCKPKCEGFPTG